MRAAPFLLVLFFATSGHAQDQPVAAPAPAVNLKAVRAATVIAREHTLQTTAVHAAATKLSPSVFESAADFRAHQNATQSIQRAARTFDAKASSLSRRDFLLAHGQITAATRGADKLNQKALRGLAVTTAEVRQLQALQASTDAMEMRMAKGEPVVPDQSMTVTVIADKKAKVNGFFVYVLPTTYMDQPEEFDLGVISSALQEFSLREETSPAHGRTPMADLRVWIGPRMEWQAMAQMVKDKKVTRTLVADGSQNIASMVFHSPQDVVRPATAPP